MMGKFFAVLLLIGISLGASAAGLDSGTQVATNFRTWAYTFLSICAGIYMIYLVLWAKAGKKSWADVGLGFVHVAVGGGAIVGADYMFNIW